MRDTKTLPLASKCGPECRKVHFYKTLYGLRLKLDSSSDYLSVWILSFLLHLSLLFPWHIHLHRYFPRHLCLWGIWDKVLSLSLYIMPFYSSLLFNFHHDKNNIYLQQNAILEQACLEQKRKFQTLTLKFAFGSIIAFWLGFKSYQRGLFKFRFMRLLHIHRAKAVSLWGLASCQFLGGPVNRTWNLGMEYGHTDSNVVVLICLRATELSIKI